MKKFVAIFISTIMIAVLFCQSALADPNTAVPETNLGGLRVFINPGGEITYGDGTVMKYPGNDILLFINGSLYVSEIIIDNDRTLVPLRFISETLGAQVGWDDATRKVTITDGNNKIEMVIGNNKPTLNGKVIQIDVAPKIYNDYTYVPLRFIAESLNCKVDWFEGNPDFIVDGPTETHYPIGSRQVIVSRYPTVAKAMTETDAIKILEDQLKIAYKTRFGVELLPLNTKPNINDEQESFRYLITHLSVCYTNDRFYNVLFVWNFMVDKYSGTVYLCYNGVPYTINIFDPYGPGGNIGFAG